jgi:hypothetical protein
MLQNIESLVSLFYEHQFNASGAEDLSYCLGPGPGRIVYQYIYRLCGHNLPVKNRILPYIANDVPRL